MNVFDEFIDSAINNWYEAGSVSRMKDCRQAPFALNGALIERIVEKWDGTLWACTDELATQINYCPICGYEAKVKIGKIQLYNK
jgi:hypothetical protein